MSVQARFSAPVQTGPGAHPTSYTMGTGTLVEWECPYKVSITVGSFDGKCSKLTYYKKRSPIASYFTRTVGRTNRYNLLRAYFCNLNFWTCQNPRMFIVVSFIWWRFQYLALSVYCLSEWWIRNDSDGSYDALIYGTIQAYVCMGQWQAFAFLYFDCPGSNITLSNWLLNLNFV